MNQKLIPFVDAEGKNHWPIHVDVKTGVLYYLKKHSGRNIKFSTKCRADQLQRAKRFANEELTKRLGKKKVVRVTPLIKDELPIFIAMKETEGLKENSVRNIKSAIEHQIEPFWGSRFPQDMLDAEIRAEWYAWFKETFPDHQMEKAIKYIRVFAGYLCQKVVNGVPLLPVSPKFHDPNYKEVRRARKKKKENIFTAEEFQRIYHCAASDDDAVLILFMYTMASRVVETLSLRFDHEIIIDVEVPTYRWSDGQNKADHDGFHSLHPSLIEPLRALKGRRDTAGTKLLFPQQWNHQAPLKPQQIDWAGWRKRAGLSWHWTAHTCRHTCLSNLFNNEHNPQVLIIKLYRISLVQALETYIKPTKSGLEQMRTALEVKL